MASDLEQAQSSMLIVTPDSITELNSLVKFDGCESVGGPCGTSRSSAELAVHMNTPRDLCSPVDDQPLPNIIKNNEIKRLTNERPARDMLRLETTYLDEIGSQPEVLERRNVRIRIDVVTEGILTRQ